GPHGRRRALRTPAAPWRTPTTSPRLRRRGDTAVPAGSARTRCDQSTPRRQHPADRALPTLCRRCRCAAVRRVRSDARRAVRSSEALVHPAFTAVWGATAAAIVRETQLEGTVTETKPPVGAARVVAD